MKLIYQKLFIPFLLLQGFLFAHCQVPCGIYNDAARIVQLQEDFATIQKAMNKIKNLSLKKDATSMNQMTRWIMTKEDHASKIQEVVSDYFLTQRIKEKPKGPDYVLYVNQTTILHQILVAAMKCKQTVDPGKVKYGLKLIDSFINLYFDAHGKDHIQKLSGSN
jgi:nickel superoxide dismutase